MRIIRVFPRKTKATPVDDMAYCGPPPFFAEADKVMISCTFKEDRDYADWLETQWRHVAPTEIGGPACGDKGGEFEVGKFIKPGYVITSRGCPVGCWFCDASKREGRKIRELDIKDGTNVLDNNLLACRKPHVEKVFAMLKKQKGPIDFSGGLEAKRLKPWHVEHLAEIKPRSMFFAYDTEDDYEPLVEASKLLLEVFKPSNHQLRCFVLCGFTEEQGAPYTDTMEKAEKRVRQVLELGFQPMAMLYHTGDGVKDPAWVNFQSQWTNWYRRAAILGKEAA